MNKTCGICGEATSSRGLIRHYKEKHSAYYKLFLRLTVLKGIVSGVAGASLLVLVSSSSDVSVYAPFYFEILAPTVMLLVVIVWVTVSLYLRKVRKSLNPSKE